MLAACNRFVDLAGPPMATSTKVAVVARNVDLTRVDGAKLTLLPLGSTGSSPRRSSSRRASR
jgi:hypothetical protein